MSRRSCSPRRDRLLSVDQDGSTSAVTQAILSLTPVTTITTTVETTTTRKVTQHTQFPTLEFQTLGSAHDGGKETEQREEQFNFPLSHISTPLVLQQFKVTLNGVETLFQEKECSTLENKSSAKEEKVQQTPPVDEPSELLYHDSITTDLSPSLSTDLRTTRLSSRKRSLAKCSESHSPSEHRANRPRLTDITPTASPAVTIGPREIALKTPTSASNDEKEEVPHLEKGLMTPPSLSRSVSQIQQFFSSLESHPLDRRIPSLQDLPQLVRTYEYLPELLKSYVLLHILKRTQRGPLQMFSSLLMQQLRRDVLGDLPGELRLQILNKLDVESLCACAQVSKRWRQLVDGDAVVWRRLLLEKGWAERMRKDLAAYLVRAPAHVHSWSQLLSQWPLSLWFHSMRDSSSTDSLSGSSMSSLPTHRASASMQAATPPPQSLLPVAEHPFKHLYAKYHHTRANWFRGRFASVAFNAHLNNVITGLYFDDDKIISGSDEASIHVYDVVTGAHRRSLRGHDGGVWCLEVVGRAKNTLVTGSTDRTVRVWDIEQGECIGVLRGHTSTVRCMAIVKRPAGFYQKRYPKVVRPTFNSLDLFGDVQEEQRLQEDDDTYLVITGSRDHTLKVWSLPLASSPSLSSGSTKTKSKSKSTSTANPGALSSILRGGGERSLSVSTVSEEEEEEMEEMEEMQQHRRTTNLPPLVPLVPLANRSLGDDEAAALHPVRMLDEACLMTFQGHEQAVRAIAAENETVVSGSYDGSVRVWSLITGECSHRLLGHRDKIYSVAYDDGIKRIASGSMDETVRVWCALSGACFMVLEGHSSLVGILKMQRLVHLPEPERPAYLAQKPSSLNYQSSPSSSSSKQQSTTVVKRPPSEPSHPVLISASADATLKVWEPLEGRLLNTLHGHRAAITCFEFDQDKLVSGAEGSIKLWDLRHGGGFFVRDVLTHVQNTWRIAMDDRRLIVAVQRDDRTWFEVLDFGMSG